MRSLKLLAITVIAAGALVASTIGVAAQGGPLSVPGSPALRAEGLDWYDYARLAAPEPVETRIIQVVEDMCPVGSVFDVMDRPGARNAC